MERIKLVAKIVLGILYHVSTFYLFPVFSSHLLSHLSKLDSAYTPPLWLSMLLSSLLTREDLY